MGVCMQMVLLMRVAVHNPVVTKSFVAGNMEAVGSFANEDMQMWREVMVSPLIECSMVCLTLAHCHEFLGSTAHFCGRG